MVFYGGVVSEAKKTSISNTKVNLKNSTMGIIAEGQAGKDGETYYSLATGGFIGFGNSGSENTDEDVGSEGITIENSVFDSTNDTKREVLYAKIETGLAPNVGGIMGLTFNNASIVNTNVNVVNGTFIAEKTKEDKLNKMSSTCGGIVGRLEHTGRIKDCTVTGNELNITSVSTGKEMYAGGIVGVDIGPWQKNVISLENTNFVGNGTSSISVQLIKGSLENKHIYSGGIAGATTYIMKNCSISGVTIYNKGSNTGDTCVASGKLAGRFEINTGMWKEKKYFIPDEIRGILNCTAKDVNIVVEDNDSGVVSIGEQYGTDV